MAAARMTASAGFKEPGVVHGLEARTDAERHALQANATPPLAFEGLEMAADPGLTLTVYAAEPGSPSEEGLRLIASWAAAQESGGAAHQPAD